jgi:hypothetical protein
VKTNTKPKRIKAKPTKGRRPREEEGRSVLARRGGRKSQGRKYNFKPAVLVHFHFAAGTCTRDRRRDPLARMFSSAITCGLK